MPRHPAARVGDLRSCAADEAHVLAAQPGCCFTEPGAYPGGADKGRIAAPRDGKDSERVRQVLSEFTKLVE